MREHKNLAKQNSPADILNAQWIWFDERLQLTRKKDFHERNSYAYFRKTFEASGQTRINIAADTQYDLFIDGKRIDRGTTPADMCHKKYDIHIINLPKGEHVIAVMVHHFGQLCATYMKSKPGLFVQIVTCDGKRINSDSTWKALPCEGHKQHLPCMMSFFDFYEDCDFSNIPKGWQELDFDDADWPNARLVDSADCKKWTNLAPRSIPLLETKCINVESIKSVGTFSSGVFPNYEKDLSVAVEMASRRRVIKKNVNLKMPIHLSQGKENEFAVFDFGREVSGYLRINLINSQSQQCVEIGYDEQLDNNGIPNPRRTYVHFADRYYLRKGQNVLEVFGPRGFRYLLVDVHTVRGGLKIKSVQLDERTYPVHEKCEFECDDLTLGHLYKTGLETLRLCMFDTYVDCPSRERVAWMDSYLQGMFTCYGMGITNLWRENLVLHAQNLCKDEPLAGAVKAFVPCDYNPVTLTHMMYYVYAVTDYLLQSGDFKTAEDLFPICLKQFEILKQFTNENGLIDNRKWHGWRLFQDWSAMDNGGINGFTNAAYIIMHKKMAELAQFLQKDSTSRNFKRKSEKIMNLYKTTFFNKKDKLFVDAVYDNKQGKVRSQLTNAMAILSGAVDKTLAYRILDKITNRKKLLPRTPGDYRLKKDFKCQTGGIVQIGTPALAFVLAYIMFKLGRDKQAIKYIKDTWKNLDSNGTFAEHIVKDDNTSFCHGWSAGPVMLLIHFILGLKPLTPGWTRIQVSPQLGSLKYTKGSVITPLGKITVSCQKIKSKLNLNIDAPEEIEFVSDATDQNILIDRKNSKKGKHKGLSNENRYL